MDTATMLRYRVSDCTRELAQAKDSLDSALREMIRTLEMSRERLDEGRDFMAGAISHRATGIEEYGNLYEAKKKELAMIERIAASLPAELVEDKCAACGKPQTACTCR